MQGYGTRAQALSLWGVVSTRVSRERVLLTDYFENVRQDFVGGDVAVVFEELAAWRAEIVGLFEIPFYILGIVPFTDFGLIFCLGCS